MLREVRASSTIAALLIVLGGTIVSCGDDEQSNLTLPEYFSQLESLAEDAGREIDAIEARYPDVTSDDESLSDAERVSQTRERINEIMVVARDIVDDLDDISPPGEAKDAHNAVTDGLRDVAERTEESMASEAYEEFIICIANASSPDEMGQSIDAFQEPELVAAGERLDEACADLEEVAAANEIEVVELAIC